jgi:hypothetical protein
MTTPRKKQVRLVRMYVRPAFDTVIVSAKDWRRFHEQPLGQPVGYDIQPEIVYDDGETLEKVEHPAVRIAAENWREYVSKTFPEEIAEWQAQLDAEASNRAQRRAKPKTAR